MGRPWVLLAGLVFVGAAFGGCVGASGGTEPLSPAAADGAPANDGIAPAQATAPVVAGEAAPADDPPVAWETLEWSGEGAAGAWVFFYHPLPEPVEDISYDLEVSVEAVGDESTPTGLFAAEPNLVMDTGDGPEPGPFWHVFETRGPLLVDRTGGTVTFDREGGMGAGIGGGSWIGFTFLVGANVPWTASVRITVDDADGGTVEPSFVSRGEGAVLFPDYERPLSVTDDGALVGELRLDAALDTPGWTHLQYEYDALQPDGVRNYEIAFPDGTTVSDIGTMRGYYIPLWGGSASYGGWYDYCGLAVGSAGQFTSRLTYAQAQLRFEAALLHLPMAEDALGPLGSLSYCDNNSPFPDGLPLRWVGDDGTWAEITHLAR